MELYTIQKNIPTVFVKATSFPNGVMDSWKKLHEKIPVGGKRRFFGISWENKDHVIEYHAAAEVTDGEDILNSGFEFFTIPKGPYRSHWIRDFEKNMSEFGRVFSEMLKDPALDPNGFCLEIYEGTEDALCLIKLDESKL